MQKVVLIISLVVMAVGLGFFQEQLKVSINYILENAPNIEGFYALDEQQKHNAIEARRFESPFDYYHSHQTLRWLYAFNEAELQRLKWIVTVVSLLVFYAFNAVLLSVLEGGRHIWLRLGVMYIAFTLLAFGVYALGRLIGMPEQTYSISRRITGALQSLVPLMILWPFLRLLKLKNAV